MPKLRIKNFGPIKAGYSADDYMEITPLTVFCGNQATGKSSVAKLYSTFVWMEKEISRTMGTNRDGVFESFEELCKKQRMEEYIRPDTELDFFGQLLELHYKHGKVKIETVKDIHSWQDYKRPKIMYVPSERNLLTTLEDAEDIKRLPFMLSIFLEEYNKARKNSRTGLFSIPVSDTRVLYNKETLSMRVLSKDNSSVSIFNSSSGIQSVVPLSIVTRYLADTSRYDLKKSIQNLSSNEKRQLGFFLEQSFSDSKMDFERAEETVDSILNGRKYSDADFIVLEEKLKPFFNSCFINIVEEPEQNLYPESQSKVLYELLECMNMNESNQLLITTHSPYMLSSLTHAAKADELLAKGVPAERMASIVSAGAAVKGEKISLYETIEDGTIRRLAPYENLPTDDNLLNRAMAFSNEQFADLLDLEQEFC